MFGKFVSDSVEFVLGASEVIGKTAGIITLIVLVLIVLSPILKILLTVFCTTLLSIAAEAIGVDSKIQKIIDGFCTTFKTIMGILIGTSITFMVSIAIILSLMGKITS